ncbi:MAG: 16S rRNA (guanine(527)-N(7))-methyltransferase RsmG [Candidatus Peribacteraceae bacterium]|nr:16S rRNA (guanine(527)-N(7))-methyltransferase RsmG [Candidatus Peribacteraceae bacterium]
MPDPSLDVRLKELLDVFLFENSRLNLSAFRTNELCWTGNILDSVSILDPKQRFIDCSAVRSIVDLGTGGGFPLLPLALALPEAHCLGIDSTTKKIEAVGRIVATMKIPNVELKSDRIEVLAHQERYREKADLVTARALAPLNVLLEYAVPLLKVGGLCAFWKSTKTADELAACSGALKVLSSRFLGSFEYDLGGAWGKRAIIFFRKDAATSNEYPRKTGMPKSEPL